MAYGIDPRLPDSMQPRNEEEGSMRFALRNALSRNELDKAKVINESLKVFQNPGLADTVAKSASDVAKIKEGPATTLAGLAGKPDPDGTSELIKALGLGDKPAPAPQLTGSGPTVPLGKRLSTGWSLDKEGRIIEAGI